MAIKWDLERDVWCVRVHKSAEWMRSTTAVRSDAEWGNAKVIIQRFRNQTKQKMARIKVIRQHMEQQIGVIVNTTHWALGICLLHWTITSK